MQTSIRTVFEESIYQDYSSTALKQQLEGLDIIIVPKAEFFKINPKSGKYILDALNFAWMGYVLGGRDALESQSSMQEEEEDGYGDRSVHTLQ